MRFRTTLFLLVLVLLVGGGIYYLERETEGTEQREARARLALDIDLDQVRYLRIETTNMVVTCRLAGSQWRIESPMKTHADRGEVRRILTGLKNLPKGEVITPEQRRERSLRLQDYGLEVPRARVTVRQDHDELTILIGDSSTIGDSLYVMEAGGEDVVATSRDLLDLLPEGVEQVRSRKLLPEAPFVLRRLEIRRPSGFVLLANDPVRGWSLQQPVESRANSALVQDLITKLSTAEVSRFVEDDVADFAAYGLDESAVHVSMMPVGDGPVRVLHLGSPDPADPEQIFARVDDGTSVFGVSRQLYTDLMLDAEVFRDRKLIDVVQPRIVYVKVSEGDDILELLKDDAGSWSLTRPRKRAADSARVWSMIAGWAEARVLNFVSDTATNRAEFGLSDPIQTVLLSVRAPDPETDAAEDTPPPEGVTQVTLHLFPVPDQPDRLYAQAAGSRGLVTTSSESFPSISGRPLWLYDRVVLQLVPGDVRKIELEDGERHQVVHADKTGAFLPGPEQAGEVHTEAITAILAEVTGLEALQFVAEDPDDLATYGLEDPVSTLTVGLTGDAGISKTLLLGDSVADGGRYAMIRGQGAVFVLSAEVCQILLSDLVQLPPVLEEGGETPADTP